MDLDIEGAGNFKQLEELIQKECNNHDRKYALLEHKYRQMESNLTTQRQQKNM